MADTGEHAFSLALAVLGDPVAAEEVALIAVRRGGRSRVATLAFTRHLSLARARQTPSDAAAQPSNVVELAVALAATRPPLERALVDLAGRHHLDRAGLGRTLGLTAAAAAERAAAVTEQWTRELDPALMAWLGPGDCPELAAVLAANGLAAEPLDPLTVTDGGAAGGLPEDPDAPAGSLVTTTATATAVPAPAPAPTVDALLAVAPAVAAHVSSCELCTDRTRAMVSVPALVGGRPLDPSPEAVRAASRRNRFRPPAPLPPAIDATGRRSWTRAAPAAAAAVVV